MLHDKKGGSFVRKGNRGFPGINEAEREKVEKDVILDGPDFSKFKDNPRASGAWDSTD
ncbi:hypothetical protein K8R62_00135 [bacterium]|nr:hypothetical protein [bacterium]